MTDMSLLETEREQARTAVVDEHIRCENRHDLDAMMATFGMDARYDDGTHLGAWRGLPATGRLLVAAIVAVNAVARSDEAPTTTPPTRRRTRRSSTCSRCSSSTPATRATISPSPLKG